MNFRAALNIAYLTPPNWPTNPADYYATEVEIRDSYVKDRRAEISADPIEYADALNQYLEQKPAEFAVTIQRACSGTVGCAVALQCMVEKAIDTYIDKEWNRLGEL